MKAVLSVLALTFLASCGGGSPRALSDRGSEALRSGNYEEAAKSFDEALTALGGDTSAPEWMKAKLGAIEARTHLDAAKAKVEFLELAAAHPSKVTDNHFSLIGSRLGDAGHLQEAVAVLDAGIRAHPESPQLEALKTDLGKRAESSGDAEALESLKGLGYVGD